jgi:hypothetical protein
MRLMRWPVKDALMYVITSGKERGIPFIFLSCTCLMNPVLVFALSDDTYTEKQKKIA